MPPLNLQIARTDTAFAPPLDPPRPRISHPALDAWLRAGVPLPAALRRLGLTLWSDGRLCAAAEALEASVTADPQDAAAWLDLGFCLRGLGNLRGALEAFERATLASPTHARAWLALGLAAKEHGDACRAEEALIRALALDKSLDDAAYSLGLLYFEGRRYAEAADRWRALAARGYKTGAIRLGLGQSCFFLGDFASSAAMLAAHLADHPGDEAIVRRHALVRFLDAAVREGPEAAAAAYAAAAGPAAEPFEKIARGGMLLLAGYGHSAAALAVARRFLPEDDADPIHRHHMAALTGQDVAQATAQYVSIYFDRFAETFDDQMAALGYRGPEKLLGLIEGVGGTARRVIDLGCGSGGAAPLLRSRCKHLVGVDLSAKMIEKARGRGLYDELLVCDMVQHLSEKERAFDLVFAADSLIYLGDLEGLIEAAARGLVAGGLFAFTLETTTRAPYALQTSGRFAHSPKALMASASRWFDLRAMRRTFLRQEAHRRINGALMVLERRG